MAIGPSPAIFRTVNYWLGRLRRSRASLEPMTFSTGELPNSTYWRRAHAQEVLDAGRLEGRIGERRLGRAFGGVARIRTHGHQDLGPRSQTLAALGQPEESRPPRIRRAFTEESGHGIDRDQGVGGDVLDPETYGRSEEPLLRSRGVEHPVGLDIAHPQDGLRVGRGAGRGQERHAIRTARGPSKSIRPAGPNFRPMHVKMSHGVVCYHNGPPQGLSSVRRCFRSR